MSLEACVIRVDREALGESADGGFVALSSVTAERLLEHAGGEDAEVVSGVTLLVGNAREGEISSRDDAREKEKDPEEEAGEYVDREVSVSLLAGVVVNTDGRITVEYEFTQLISEQASSESVEGEHEEDVGQVFEVSSAIGLQAGRPRVAGAKRIEDHVMFLILHADI